MRKATIAKVKPVNIKVMQDLDNPVPTEIMADAIMKIQQAFDEINRTRLSRKALVVLIAHNSKLPQYQVELVLNNLDQLADTWLKKTK